MTRLLSASPADGPPGPFTARLHRLLDADDPVGVSRRVVGSLVRRRLPGRALRAPVVPYAGCRVRADLRTSLGLGPYRYRSVAADVLSVLDALAPGQCFFDGGANVGLFTLPAARSMGPTGRVIAVEPGRVVRSLIENVELSGFENVQVVNAALGPSDGDVRLFHDRPGDGAGLSSFAPPGPREPGHRQGRCVVQRTLDLLTEGTEVHVVKLDLEGAEVGALQGAGRLLSTSRPRMLIEVDESNLQRQGASVEELYEVLRSFDYRPAAAAGATPPNMWFEPE